MKEVDARGLSCPQPVLMILDAIREGTADSIAVLIDSETSKENVIRAATSQGWKHEETKNPESAGFQLLLKKG